MSFTSTAPRGSRLHIGLFGKRNAGKSSVINALTGQNTAIVSPQKGTTTDPVSKAMELLPIGPVQFTDTAGIDDAGELGSARVEKSLDVLNRIHLALYIIDAPAGKDALDDAFLEQVKDKKLPFIIVYNKTDQGGAPDTLAANEIAISSETGQNIDALKALIVAYSEEKSPAPPLVSDLITQGDTILLVTPIDESAPKGRLILPQQQVLRELLDTRAHAMVMQEDGVADVLGNLKAPPALVITDSKVFKEVAPQVDASIPLTSFSILFARHNGILKDTLEGIKALGTLQNGDKVLIAEGCTHHRQCDDIGTVRIPALLSKLTRKELAFSFTSGGDFPGNLEDFSLVVHCGGCMLTDNEVKNRLQKAATMQIPMTNYGLLFAEAQGILKRSVEIFKDTPVL